MTVHVLGSQKAWISPDPTGGWSIWGEEHYNHAEDKSLYIRTQWSLCHLNHTYNAQNQNSEVLFFDLARFIRLWKKDADSVCKSCIKKICRKYQDVHGHPLMWTDETVGMILLGDMNRV